MKCDNIYLINLTLNEAVLQNQSSHLILYVVDTDFYL